MKYKPGQLVIFKSEKAHYVVRVRNKYKGDVIKTYKGDTKTLTRCTYFSFNNTDYGYCWSLHPVCTTPLWKILNEV